MASLLAATFRALSLSTTRKTALRPTTLTPSSLIHSTRAFSSTRLQSTTLMQVLRGARKPRRQRHKVSPGMVNHPSLKGICLKISIQKPKKPNSAQRQVARVRLSTGRVVTAYIPGEGHNAQQHHTVLVRGGRAQDCPGVRYHLVRGAGDLGGVAGRITSRSKYGAKKPKS